MTDDLQDFAALKKRMLDLTESLRELSCLVIKARTDWLEETSRTRDALNQLQRNQRFLYEMIAPVFAKHFPENWKYSQEFDRILGTEPKPDETKPRKDTR